jgi:hypothetical protein
LKDLKEVDESLRQAVKAEYKVIDKTSSEHCTFFRENIYTRLEKLKNEDFDDDVSDQCVCRGITLRDVMKHIDEDDADTKAIVMNYIFTLTLFAYVYGLDLNDDEGEVLLNQVIEALGQIQHDEEVDNEILDDDVNILLDSIKKYPAPSPASISQPTDAQDAGNDEEQDPMSIFAALGDSKIANIAKEISKDIDTSKLKADNPDELIKNMFDFSNGNNMLGNIVQKVSTTLNDKISSGELKHEELIGEAMSMMNLFGGKGGSGMAGMMNNPLFSQMMKGMKSGKAGVRQDVISKATTRDRLRKKLESRNKNKNVE